MRWHCSEWHAEPVSAGRAPLPGGRLQAQHHRRTAAQHHPRLHRCQFRRSRMGPGRRHPEQSVTHRIYILHKRTPGRSLTHPFAAVKYLSQTTNIAIIRTSRPTLSTVWAAITLIRAIKNVELCARVIHVGGESLTRSANRLCCPHSCRDLLPQSGTIRKTQQAAIRYDRQVILALESPDPGV